jgi:hypothetical protein
MGGSNFSSLFTMVHSPFGAEGTWDMAVDPNGNVYTLARVGDTALSVGGTNLNGYGKVDILLTSFTCDGVYRWSKVIGTNLDSDAAMAVKTDGAGAVYVCGMMTLLTSSGSTGGHISSDTTIGNTAKTIFLVKWDTGGTYKWLRMPQPDTISHLSANNLSLLLDMDVDEGGNTYMLAYLTPGAYGGNAYVVTSPGCNILKYSPTGQLLGGIVIPITYTGNIAGLLKTKMKYNGGLSRFIITGISGYGTTVTVAGTNLGNVGVPFVAVFSNSGTTGFVKTGTGVNAICRARTDNQNNIYVAGTGGYTGTFNGNSFQNISGSYNQLPFASKLDATTGASLWFVSGKSADGCAAMGIDVTNGKVLIGGNFWGKVVFPTDSFSSVIATDSLDCFIMQLNAGTGAIQKISAPTSGYDDEGINQIVADRRGNFYVGGTFGGSGTFNIGGSVLQSAGGFEAFIGKWGYSNCNCILPTASYTFTTSGKTATYTYTGTTSGIDSLVWEWGDGQRQKLTSGFSTGIPHTFAANGHYNVCVTVYSTVCGTNTYCKQLPLAVGTIAGLEGFHVYPNPANRELTFDGLGNGSAALYTMDGRLVNTIPVTNAHQKVDISGLPSGAYLLKVTNAAGVSSSSQFSKY